MDRVFSNPNLKKKKEFYMYVSFLNRIIGMIIHNDQSYLGLMKLFSKHTLMICFWILDNPVLACFFVAESRF